MISYFLDGDYIDLKVFAIVVEAWTANGVQEVADRLAVQAQQRSNFSKLVLILSGDVYPQDMPLAEAGDYFRVEGDLTVGAVGVEQVSS